MKKKGTVISGEEFERAKGRFSAEFIRLNPSLHRPAACAGAPPAALKASGGSPGKRRRQMNKTEALYAKLLEIAVNRREILRYEYEGMTLRWGTLDSIKYTPDFTVFEPVPKNLAMATCLKFIEVKGSHIWQKDIDKFKAARNQWPMFLFQMWQYKGGNWTQLL